MGDYEWLDAAPSTDDAPDECQMTGCDHPATHYMVFKKPKEYVCYCRTHLGEVRDECDYARASAMIR